MGKWKNVTSDVEGNLTTVTEPDPCVANATLATNYTYDWAQHLTGVSMSRSNTSYAANGTCSESGTPVTQTRTFVYDDAGRLTSASNPENGTVLYYYNSDNSLQHKHDGNGDTVYTWAGPGKIATVQGGGSTVTYSWDTNPYDSTGFSHYTRGRLTAVQYGTNLYQNPSNAQNIVEMYSYDIPGNVTAKRMQITAWGEDVNYGNQEQATGSIDVAYTYTSDGKGATVDYPMHAGYRDYTGVHNTNTRLTYGYDSMDRLTSLGDDYATVNSPSGTQWVASVAYDLAGRLTGLLGETRSYNVNGQLEYLNYPTQPGIHYIYSATQNNGQITQAADTFGGSPGVTVTYQYDSLKRLISAVSVRTADRLRWGGRRSSGMTDLGI